MGRGNPSDDRRSSATRHTGAWPLATRFVGEACAYVQGFGPKAHAASSEAFQLPDLKPGRNTVRTAASAMLVAAAGIGFIVLVVAYAQPGSVSCSPRGVVALFAPGFCD